MEKSENKYRRIVQLASDGIITVSLDGVITSINQAFQEATGYSEKEIVAKHVLEIP
jgi:PAS domain S-box-containing protein